MMEVLVSGKAHEPIANRLLFLLAAYPPYPPCDKQLFYKRKSAIVARRGRCQLRIASDDESDECMMMQSNNVTPTIALVDDDRNILRSLAISLQAEGFATRLYGDGKAALNAMLDNPPDLAVFDIKMPRMDGFELLRRLREKSQIPVIFLTSKDDESDEALGLAIGADDYIVKPFSPRLVIARIRVILRRVSLGRDSANEAIHETNQIIERGRLVIDQDRHKILWDGKIVKLTVTEFLILEMLALRPGIVRSRNQLMDAAYQDDVYNDDRTIDSHIKRLRRKFREIDSQFDRIETLYGSGYRFSESV